MLAHQTQIGRTIVHLVICVAAFALHSGVVTADEWVPLFNGRDLTGWIPKFRGYELGENFANTFRVEDGLLKVRYDGYEGFDEQFGHLFYKETLSHYRLRIEYRFVGEQCEGGSGWAWRNSGVMLHGQQPNAMEIDQDFPDSIEVQFLGGDGTEPRPTANLCTPGTQVVLAGELFKPHCTKSSSRTYHGDQWVTVEIEVLGNELIRHIVDGATVLEYSQPQLDDGTPLRDGTISLQSESHPIDFRRIELLKLEK